MGHPFSVSGVHKGKAEAAANAASAWGKGGCDEKRDYNNRF